MAILQRTMTPEAWIAIGAEHFKKRVALRFAIQIVPWAAQEVPRPALDRVFAEAGLGFKLIWIATRRRFTAREARTFHYVP